jgi:hypothetical protein
MVRRRADEPALPVEHGIEERVIQHVKTKRGIRTKEKSVPILKSVKKKPSRSKPRKDQSGPELAAEGSGATVPLVTPSNYQYDEGQVDGLHDVYPEHDQPPPSVCTTFHFDFTGPGSVRFRVLWNNGLMNVNRSISRYY